MGAFLARRGLQALATILLSTLVVHVAVTVLPGDPVRALFGIVRPPPELVEAVRARYNLDEPYVVQYWLYLKDVVSFDLGTSLRFGRDVNSMVAEAWPVTVRLVALALGLQVVVGGVASVWTAIRPSSWTSRAILVSAVLMIAVPVVLSTYILQGLFGLQWQVFPISGVRDGWMSYVLPASALAAMTLGTVVIFMRSELRQTLRTPYIHFATASGIGRPRVIGVHALRAATPPVVAYLASNLGHVVVGVMVVEGVFGMPGLGDVVLQAIRNQDRSVVSSLVLLITIVVILLNLFSDIVVAALDPRVRSGVEAERAP